MSADQKITQADIDALRARVGDDWIGSARSLLDPETLLLEHVSNGFADVRALAVRLGLGEAAAERLMRGVGRLLMESLMLVDESHRRMWDDFLPGEVRQ